MIEDETNKKQPTENKSAEKIKILRKDISIGEMILSIAGLLTAFGTIFLAYATVESIRVSRNSVQVAEDSIKVSRENIEISKEMINLTRGSIESSKEIFIKTYRPWIDIRGVNTRIDEKEKIIYFTFEPVVSGSYAPAQNVHCGYTSQTRDHIEQNNIKLNTNVLLPGNPIEPIEIITISSEKYFNNVLKYGDSSTVTIGCSYVMVEDQKNNFETSKQFILSTREYRDVRYHEHVWSTIFLK